MTINKIIYKTKSRKKTIHKIKITYFFYKKILKISIRLVFRRKYGDGFSKKKALCSDDT